MKQSIFWLLSPLWLLTLAAVLPSCSGRKHDVAYYEQMVDSIRKAEAVKELYQKANAHGDPAEQFFDTLARAPLPVASAGAHWQQLGRFSEVSPTLCVRLGFPADSRLRVQWLPRHNSHHVLLLVDETDSTTVSLYLYTLDRQREVADHLCIYEEKSENRERDFGRSYMDYYITSTYQVTLLRYYQSHDKQTRELLDTRRYNINAEGMFEEAVVEL